MARDTPFEKTFLETTASAFRHSSALERGVFQIAGVEESCGVCRDLIGPFGYISDLGEWRSLPGYHGGKDHS
jgi:hypothetical protein